MSLSKGVKFADMNEIFHIDHLDDITDKEVAETWYNAKEYSEIKSNYQATIFIMEQGHDISGDELTSRGLEYRTQDGAWARYENKRDAYNAVLDEQDRQWKVDRDDDEKIRDIYLDHSEKCATAAHVRALEDEKVSRKILRHIMPRRRQGHGSEGSGSNAKKAVRRSSKSSVDHHKEVDSKDIKSRRRLLAV